MKTHQNRLEWISDGLEGTLMGKSKTILSVCLIGMSMLLCAQTFACPCPPCPPCHTLISGWPYCDCEDDCDPLKCENCKSLPPLGHSCVICDGDPGKVCCDGECEPKCDIVDGESCSGLSNGSCNQCAVLGDEGKCGEIKIWASPLFSGNKEKICDPRGCPGDCTDGTKHCYTITKCRIDLGIPLMGCATIRVLPNGNIFGTDPYCAVGGIICWMCIPYDEEDHHYVHNDSCQ